MTRLIRLNPVRMSFGVAGAMRVQLYRSDGSLKFDSGFHNLITNGGLDRIGTAADYLDIFGIGAGTTAPAFTDTALASPLGFASNAAGGIISDVFVAQSAPPYFVTRNRTMRFPAGIGTGTIAEVAVGWGITSPVTMTAAYARALILDGLGAPTTIQKLADESLDVTYRSVIIPPASDVITPITITTTQSGQPDIVTNHNVTVRASNVTTPGANGWGMPMQAVDGAGSGVDFTLTTGPTTDVTSRPTETLDGQPDSVIQETYVNGSKQRRFIYTWGLTKGNSFPWPTFTVDYGPLSPAAGATFQGQFSPSIVKTSTMILTLPWRLSWDRTTMP